MPLEQINGTDQKYFLISFDADGNERTDDPNPNDLISRRILQALTQEPITDVFMLSHGWKGDVPAAREQFESWIGAMLRNQSDRERMIASRPGFKPMFIGLHWPSQPWGEESFSGSGVSFSTPVGSPVDALIKHYSEQIADTPRAKAAMKVIIESAMEDLAPAEMPEKVKEAYLILDQEAGLGSAGESGAPGDDREAFDPEETYLEARDEAVVNFGGGFDLGGLLSPLRQLSFWKMKDRARKVGENGATKLLAEMQNATGPHVRFHLMGHSFGCIVVSATVVGPRGAGPVVRPVNSVALVQGALSIWAYCSDIPHAPGKPGYFRSFIADRRVSGPVITTRTEFDTAVGRIYPLGARLRSQVAMAPGEEFPKYAGLGAFGIRGPGIEIVDQKLLSADGAYTFEPGKVYNLESDEFINEGEGVSGAHSDIAKPQVWHAIWEAARQSR